MKPEKQTLEELLNQRHQWVVPVYQRQYKWKSDSEKQIPTFWDELQEQATRRLANESDSYPHYFGALICTKEKPAQRGAIPCKYLVDGQQRITTFNLLLTAIREVARNYEIRELVSEADAHLFNEFNEESNTMKNQKQEHHKLWPSQHDRALYLDIVGNPVNDLRSLLNSLFYKNGNLIKGKAPNMLRAYWYFYEEITSFVNDQINDPDVPQQAEDCLRAILDSFLDGFQIVLITLGKEDDPQEIFASLNGLGEALSPFDLVRNFVFQRTPRKDQDQLFDRHWAEFETPFWSKQVRQGRHKKARADHLIAHSLVAETGNEINVTKIAVEYQQYSQNRKYDNIEEELQVLRDHANTYRTLVEIFEQDSFTNALSTDPLTRIASVFRIWDMSTFYPLILWINRYINDPEDKQNLYSYIENYIIRREICGLSVKGYNKVVAGIIRTMKKTEDKPNSFLAHIRSLEAEASRMPTNKEVGREIMTRPIYNQTSPSRIRYILERIENHMRAMRPKLNETIVVSEGLTVEHIMPQHWAKHWPLPNSISVSHILNIEDPSFHLLMPEKIDIDQKTVELVKARNAITGTLGNLTIVTGARNSKLGNAAWEKKREQFSDSHLVLNGDIAKHQEWNEACINMRAQQLTSIVNDLWKN